jgi:hypothetical protein
MLSTRVGRIRAGISDLATSGGEPGLLPLGRLLLSNRREWVCRLGIDWGGGSKRVRTALLAARGSSGGSVERACSC